MKKQLLISIVVVLLIVGGLGWYAYTQVYTVQKSLENTIALGQYESTFAVQQVSVAKVDSAKPSTSSFSTRVKVNGDNGTAMVELDELQGKKSDKPSTLWKSGSTFYSRIEDDQAQQYIGTSLKGEYYKLDDNQKGTGTNFFERFNVIDFTKHLKDANYDFGKLNPYLGKRTYRFNLDNTDNFKKLFSVVDAAQVPEYNKDKTDVYVEFEKGLVKTIYVYLSIPQKNSPTYSETSSMYTYKLVSHENIQVELPQDYQGLKTLNEIVTAKTAKK
jgi:hypothetical protein